MAAGNIGNAYSGRLRTAVLVVHGIGNQRALETVRGIVDAIWLKDPNQARGSNRSPPPIWSHPEPSGVDIDLSVLTTDDLKVDHPVGTERAIDFHELYWAHLMSETRAIAVLLWLFELVRKGPKLNKGMQALWWAATTFVCLVLASVVLIAVQLISHLTRPDDARLLADVPSALALAPIFALSVWLVVGFLAALFAASWRLTAGLLILAAIGCGLFGAGLQIANLPLYATLYLAPFLSLLVARIVLGTWGLCVMIGVFFIGCLSVPVYFWATGTTTPDPAWGAWSLAESWSHIVAYFMVAIYLALNAIFLQSFLGDAARYFRDSPGNVAVRREIRKQAVDTLHELHCCGRYDRIVVVAHSLGSVIAYDMLRAYYSRICNNLPPPNALPTAATLDGMTPAAAAQNPAQFRTYGRDLVREIAAHTPTTPTMTNWLVSDFVTLGAALRHAKFLMCDEPGDPNPDSVFDRRIQQREYPTCPPAQLGIDGLLLFNHNNSPKFHHGGLFAMTRWKNLYFPMRELLWGDAIGGPLKDLFGPCVEDVALSIKTRGPRSLLANFFTHTSYWRLTCPGGANAAHLVELRNAINLKDG